MKPIEVLLIEDEPGDVLLIRQALAEESFPIHIHAALDGEQATQMLESPHFHPDLIILDVNVPKVPGLALLEECPPEVPVVVFTSSSNPEERLRWFDLGVKEFVQKPTDLREYKRQVSQMVRNWGMAPIAA